MDEIANSSNRRYYLDHNNRNSVPFEILVTSAEESHMVDAVLLLIGAVLTIEPFKALVSLMLPLHS